MNSSTLTERATIDAIKQWVDIVGLVAGYVPLQRAGGLYKARCPFHAERTPSFIVTPERQTWHCFGACGTGGDCFTFLMKVEGIDFAEALRRLGDNANIAAPLPPRPIPAPTPPAWQSDAERLVAAYCQAPDRYAAWAAYKPISRATIERYELGVGVLPEFSTSCQHRRLIVPSRRNGVVVALAGREMGCGCEAKYRTKWVNAKGGEGRLFNEDGLKRNGVVVVTENRIDALLAMEQDPGVIGVALGSSHPSHRWTIQIAESQPRRVIVWLDNDLAGCPNDRLYQTYLNECRAAGKRPNPPGGVVLVNELCRMGVNAESFMWPDDTEEHYDLGRLIGKIRAERVSG